LGQRGSVSPDAVDPLLDGTVGLVPTPGGVVRPERFAVGRPAAAAFACGPPQGLAAHLFGGGIFAAPAARPGSTGNSPLHHRAHTTGGLTVRLIPKVQD